MSGYVYLNVTMHELEINDASLDESMSSEILGSYEIKINVMIICNVTPCSFVDTFQHIGVTF